MKRFLISFAGTFLALLVFFVLVPVILISVITSNSASQNELPDNIVLSLDLRSPPNDQPATSGFAALSNGSSFIEIVHKIYQARSDERVKGIFIRANEFGIYSAHSEELRDALKAFQGSGKFVNAHSQGFYSSSLSAYRAISTADSIAIQPGADFSPSGISYERLFYKGLFDKLGFTAEIEQFHEFKNAPNVYKQEGYTEAHRLATEVMGRSLWTTSLTDVGADRDMGPEILEQLLMKNPVSAEDAVATGLADELSWPEDAAKQAKDQAGEGAELVTIANYIAPRTKSKNKIAIIGGQGPIVTGSGETSPFSDSPNFGSDRVAGLLLSVLDDEDIDAVVFRVDSPGGSPTASDQIWRAIERLQEKDIPVVVSMGTVAASGGYYVSTGADAIIAQPSTITGSIGIFGGKIATADGLSKIGINTDEVLIGSDYAGIWGAEVFTEEQRQKLRTALERGYDRFVGLVAEGRGLPVSDVYRIAKGRVWTGRDAMEVGLVDKLGGLHTAISHAEELAELENPAEIVFYSETPTLFEVFGSLFGVSAEAARSLAIIAQASEDLGLIDAAEYVHMMEHNEGRYVYEQTPALK